MFLKDSLEVIRAIKRSENWSLRSFVVDILELFRNFASIEIMHLSRALNVTAHSLVKFYFSEIF